LQKAAATPNELSDPTRGTCELQPRAIVGFPAAQGYTLWLLAVEHVGVWL